ncbi:NADPH:quinone reductase [Maritalea myrionectae]|uniref:NADPH:quinone reductase n=1 Tax=Maritalea myrionectae TaxID=454601 RepID=A0A2R4MBI1_9HYPH|nr:NAD(P)-dependent alcohol dehydrogenase [Maritalea myrionectae]AVX03323.1 NADPH:quinone reductase [Maritalea myrionectae]
MTNETMKALYQESFGGPEVLEIREVPKPKPADNEILIKVEAAHMGNGDQIARTGNSPWPLMKIPAKIIMGFFKPRIKIPGGEFAGIVERVGQKVTQYKVGDRVFGFTDMQFGAHAQFVTLPEKAPITLLPEGVSFDAGAAIGGSNAQTAMHFINVANIQKGEQVLINGASGGIGRVATQLAKAKGATVTGTCSAQNKELVLALGADEAIDYRETDFTTQGKKYDVIIDCAGFLPWRKVEPVLTAKGRHLLAMFGFSHLWKQRQTKGKGGKQQLCVLAPSSPDKLEEIANRLADGSLKPIISHRFPMNKAIDAAWAYENKTREGCIVFHPQEWNA